MTPFGIIVLMNPLKYHYTRKSILYTSHALSWPAKNSCVNTCKTSYFTCADISTDSSSHLYQKEHLKFTSEYYNFEKSVQLMN